MVLDPLTAFSTACNVLQLVETGATVLSKAAEYRGASDGMLAEHKDLRAILLSLQRLNDDLQTTLPKVGGSRSLNGIEQRLVESNEECLRLSKDFIALLDRLKVENPHALSETIRMSIKSLWYRDRIKAMDKNVSRARDNLSLSFLVYVNSKQSSNIEQSVMSQQSFGLERNILQAVSNSSSLIHDEVKVLAQRLEGISLDSVQTVFEEFSTEHRQFLGHFSRQLDSICAMHNRVQSPTRDVNTQDAHRKLVESLYFPQIQDRRDHIKITYHDTYRWVLNSKAITDTRWDSFVAWLDDIQPSSNIYWINSKPGAGKSSLVRFLDEQFNSHQYMPCWSQQMPVLRTQYYFWSSGDALQKNIAGFLRTILYQLFGELPELVPQCISPRKWDRAQSGDGSGIHWTDYELRECLRKAIVLTISSAKILFLVDGLDEIDGDEDVREELVELLKELSSHSNVKLCVSSRCWTVFQDAFVMCPQLRLENLNGQDIEAFVRRQFQSQHRYQQMLMYDTAAANELVSTVISKAEGVFLWARLVVKELVRGLRDGDSNRVLQKKLWSIPGNLDQYFRRLVESIEPHHRREASTLLQIALHTESEFITLTPLRLMDMIFIDDANVDFALEMDHEIYLRSFKSAEALYFKLESTLRRLLSHCKGLVECYDHPRSGSRYVKEEGEEEEEEEEEEDEEEEGEEGGEGGEGGEGEGGEGEEGEEEVGRSAETLRDREPPVHTITALPRTLIPQLDTDRHRAFDFQVDFMHRSLRDYLLKVETQDFLYQYTGGAFDARNYLRNARLMQIYMHMSADFSPGLTVGLASYFISTLSLPHFRNDSRSAQFATKFQPAVDYIRHSARATSAAWYICESLETWFQEQSNFISLAIDFALTGYLATALTAQMVRGKLGRPLLDYVLRPRFAQYSTPFVEMIIGNQVPIPELMQSLLSFGADPNQLYKGVSIWSLFLSFIASSNYVWSDVERARTAYFMSLEALIRAGADLWISKSTLFAALNQESNINMSYVMSNEESSDIDYLFQYHWPGLACEEYPPMSGDRYFSVLDILEDFRPIFGNAIENLKMLVWHRANSVADAQRYGYNKMSSSASDWSHV